jgi:hypothetical protein
MHKLVYLTTLWSLQHLELGRQWEVTVFYTFCIKRRVCIFNTKNLYGNDT